MFLNDIAKPRRDARVYQIQDIERVYERARSMLKRARKVVLVEAFPVPMENHTPAI